MFQSHLFKSFSFLLLLVAIVSVAVSQSDQPGQPETDLPTATATPVAAPPDNATLNLHRWGAVTLFHGLPSDRVNAIAEDSSGVLWFGTDNGLVRYDGRNVEAAPNEAALPSRRILALKLDHRGHLWIGTDAGAARLRDGRVEALPETRGRAVTGIASSYQSRGQGEVAVVTTNGEIIRYQEQAEGEYRGESASRNRLIATKLDPNTHPLLKSPNQSNSILPLTAITATSAGDWLIGSGGRGLIINRANDLREALINPPRPYFVSSIHNDGGDDGSRVWIAEQVGPRAGGLWFWSGGALTRTSLGAGAITAVHGGDGELWAGTGAQGAYLLKFENNDVKRLEHLTFDNTAGGLRSNRVNAIFRDREGVVWFGTDRGICRYDRSSFRASQVSGGRQSNYVRVMLHTSTGETWLGTNRGLFKLTTNDSATGADSWAEVAELQGRSVYTLAETGGAVWAGTDGGLFAKLNDGFSRVPSAPSATITITGANEAEQPVSSEGRQPDGNQVGSRE